MAQTNQEILEARIDELLNGGLDETQRRQVLERISRDDFARGLLADALRLQADARAAYGYDRACEAMHESLRSLTDVLAGSQGGRPRLRKGERSLRSLWRPSTLARIAAVAVVLVSAYLAVTAHRANQALQEKLSRPEQPPAMPRLTATELAGYRAIWNEVVDQTRKTRPWVLLSDGAGQFGYVPTAGGPTGENNLVLLRCILVGTDGQNVSTVNLLLPARQNLRLSVPEASWAAGLPLHCDVWVGERWVGLGLAAGNGSPGAPGIRGRTAIGGEPSEIGSFLLDGRTMRVVLQAVPLNVAAS